MNAEPDRGHAIVMAAVAELDELHDLRAEIDDQIATRAQRAVEGLRLHVAERQLKDGQYSAELVRRLYWQCPDVRVNDIAKALGMRSVQEVIKAAGPGRFSEPCRAGCGTLVERTVKSRSDAAKGGGRASWTDPRVCASCRAARQAAHEADYQRWRVRWSKEQERSAAAIARLRADGVQPVARYVEYPGVGGTFTDPDYEPPSRS